MNEEQIKQIGLIAEDPYD